MALAVSDAVAVTGCIAISPTCTCGPQVDLQCSDVDVIAFVSDGVDELAVAAGASREELRGKVPELLALGLRTASTPCRQASLQVDKGGAVSRADDTVALCVAQRAAELLQRQREDAMAPRSYRVLDPMCGVGTYLFALRWVLSREKAALVELVGVDSELESLLHAMANGAASDDRWLGQPPNFIMGSSRALPLQSNSVDAIVVDPPWGHRHGSHTYVKKNFYYWANEWARVLRPGGFAVVVTPCLNLFRGVVMPRLKGRLVLEDSFPFDNKGHCHCQLFVVRKPATTDADPAEAPRRVHRAGKELEADAT